MAEAQQIYQAIGELQATLVVAEDGKKFLEIGSDQYPVSIPYKLQKKYQNKSQGQQVVWQVYPIATGHGLTFRVVALVDQLKFGIGRFKLQGGWGD